MFTQSEMEQALYVISPDDWRQPIDVLIEDPGPRNLECLAEAIIQFTGAPPVITKLDDGVIKVQALGYLVMRELAFQQYLH